MRRIVLIGALVVVLGVAGYFLLRPKNSASGVKTASADTGKKKGRRTGKTAGRIKPKSKAELKAERKQRRKEERKRRKEERRRERDKRRRLRRAGRKSSKRGSKRRGSKGRSYVVRAIVSLGEDSYALVDSRRVTVGDVVMGRRIVAIHPDHVEIEAFGKRSSVRVGESLMPLTYSSKRRRRRG